MKIKLSLITKVATLSDTDEDLTAKDRDWRQAADGP